MFNQDGSVLRVETVINQPDEVRIRRTRTPQPEARHGVGVFGRSLAVTLYSCGVSRGEARHRATERLSPQRSPRERRHHIAGEQLERLLRRSEDDVIRDAELFEPREELALHLLRRPDQQRR